jgi:hypothetical protein
VRDTPRLFWTLPLHNNPDKVIAISFAEFIRKKGNDPYSLGEALAYISRRAPALRANIAATHSHGGNTAVVAV